MQRQSRENVYVRPRYLSRSSCKPSRARDKQRDLFSGVALPDLQVCQEVLSVMLNHDRPKRWALL